MSLARRASNVLARAAVAAQSHSLRPATISLVSRPVPVLVSRDFVPAWGAHVRWMSANGNKEESKGQSESEGSKSGQAAEGAETKKEGSTPSGAEQTKGPTEVEILNSQLKEKMDLLKKKDEEIKELKNKVLTAYADVENMRVRMRNKEDEDRKFAVRGFAKSMLEVADILDKALKSMPEEKRKDNPDLQTVFEGVDMTQRIFMKGLEAVHVKMFDPQDQKFDPNLHQALFEIPAGDGEKGIVKAVVKTGYMIHDRVLRPAEVGVTK